jgi:hypothetical protein
MRFREVFLAVFLGGALVVAALLVNQQRPASETSGPGPQHVKATGKCAECHREETSAVVHQFESSVHAQKGVTCLDCHRASAGQQAVDHRGFAIATELTSKNCAACHATQYEQFARSRHAAPAWAAVAGRDAFTEEQMAHASKYHAAAMDRGPNALAQLEGDSAIASGCGSCHSVGRPNADGSLGTCTQCHSRHSASVALARQPATCGQCHMGPDHSQLEIYEESKHGVLFQLQRDDMHLDADPKHLTTADMPVPTCATCHMSGLEGLKTTHDTTERLSYYLFDAVSEKRAGYARGQEEMKEVCTKCHAKSSVSEFYSSAEAAIVSTNDKVRAVEAVMAGLRADKLLTVAPFDEPIEFAYFDYWHYFGRTAKHGAFMGGADFVQWHGNYELLLRAREIEESARELRHAARAAQETPP